MNSGGSSSNSGGASDTGGSASGGVTGSGGSAGQGGAQTSSGGAGGAKTDTSVKGGGGNSSGGNSGSGSNGGAGGSVAASGGAAGGSSAGGAGGGNTGPAGPCDIYQAANTPCGAAHSTARALYAAYNGPLYQVQRASNKTTKDIVVGPDGFAKTSDQDSFCSGTTCTIPVIYDQSPNANHLRVTWWGYWMQSGANPAKATEAKATVGGHTVYGIRGGGSVQNVGYRTGVALPGTASVTKGSATVTFSQPQTLPANTILIFTVQAKDCPPNSWPNNCKIARSFTAAAITDSTTVTLTSPYQGTSDTATTARNETTRGIAIDDEAEAMYSVFDGKIFNQWCCFDYGAAEMTGIDEGNATMEALYFGSVTQVGQSGGGTGPWVAADLENGVYEGYGTFTQTPSPPSRTPFSGDSSRYSRSSNGCAAAFRREASTGASDEPRWGRADPRVRLGRAP